MSEAFEIANGSVAEILHAMPYSASVFNQWKTACVGCHFARFCTLTDVVVSYQFDGLAFLTAFAQSLKQNHPS